MNNLNTLIAYSEGSDMLRLKLNGGKILNCR